MSAPPVRLLRPHRRSDRANRILAATAVLLVLSGCSQRLPPPTTAPAQAASAPVISNPAPPEQPSPVLSALAQAVQEAEARMRTPKSERTGALVFTVRPTGMLPVPMDGEVESGGGSHLLRVDAGRPTVDYLRAGVPSTVRVQARGYHEFKRDFSLQAGRVTVWDDVILEQVEPSNQAGVRGQVWVEGDVDPSSVVLRIGSLATTAPDSAGRFVFSELGAGKVHVSASREGYRSDYTWLELKRGEEATCTLRLYRQRYALVRWAHQPEKGKLLAGWLRHGVAVLNDDGLDRVSFATELTQVEGRSDFGVRQKAENLLLRIADGGRNAPGILRVTDASFDHVGTIPRARYKGGEHVLEPGATFVLLCYDGEHYAKMEVLDVSCSREALTGREVAGTMGCLLPPSPHSLPGDPLSLAVLDFDAEEPLQAVAEACADLCREVVQNTRQLILLERDGMRLVLGEEDLAAAMHCDDTRCLVDYGRKLRAQKLLHGRIRTLGGEHVLALKIVDVGTGAVNAFHTLRARADAESMFAEIEPSVCNLLAESLANGEAPN